MANTLASWTTILNCTRWSLGDGDMTGWGSDICINRIVMVRMTHTRGSIGSHPYNYMDGPESKQLGLENR